MLPVVDKGKSAVSQMCYVSRSWPLLASMAPWFGSNSHSSIDQCSRCSLFSRTWNFCTLEFRERLRTRPTPPPALCDWISNNMQKAGMQGQQMEDSSTIFLGFSQLRRGELLIEGFLEVSTGGHDEVDSPLLVDQDIVQDIVHPSDYPAIIAALIQCVY